MLKAHHVVRLAIFGQGFSEDNSLGDFTFVKKLAAKMVIQNILQWGRFALEWECDVVFRTTSNRAHFLEDERLERSISGIGRG